MEPAPGGQYKNNFGFLLFVFGLLFSQISPRRKNRLRLHHHPLPSTEGRIIYDAMLVARPSAQVMNVQVECTTFLSAFHHAFVERRAASFREKRDDIDAHEVANMRSSRAPSRDPVEVTLKLCGGIPARDEGIPPRFRAPHAEYGAMPRLRVVPESIE